MQNRTRTNADERGFNFVSQKPNPRADLVALIAYTLLAILLTYPLVLNFATHVPGDGGDDPALAWNLWWVPHALINLGQSPIYTQHMFYPIGINLAFYTLTYLNAFLAIPIQYAFNLVIASNVNVLFSLVMSGFGAYLLVKYLLRITNCQLPITNLAAFIAGAVYAFSANKLLYISLGQFNIASSHWIPFYILFLLKLTHARNTNRELRITNYELRIGFLLGLFLLFQALSEFIYASFLILFTALYLAYWFVAHRRELLTFRFLLLPFVVAIITFTLPMAPILAAMFQDMRTEGDFIQQGLGFADVFSSDALGFFVPSRLHPIFGGLETQFDFAYTNFAFLGFGALAFAIIALWKIPRARIWGIFGAIFVLISLGPALSINGARFDLPMPFDVLLEIPFVKGNRYPSRWSVMVTLALAILVGYGIAWASEKLKVKSQRQMLLLTVYCLLFTLFEHLALPLPLSNFTISDVYDTIARDPGDFTVLEIPLAWRNGFRMTGTLDQAMMFAQWYQTKHRRPILGGNTSRNPELKFQYFTEAPVINSIIAVETGHKLDDATIQRDKQLASDVLRFFGVRYVVWHSPRQEQNRAALENARAYIENVLPVTKFYDATDDTGQTIAYRVNNLPAQTATMIQADDSRARMSFAEGWGAQGESLMWATRKQARVMVRIAKPNNVAFSFSAFTPIPEQRVRVSVNEQLLCVITLELGEGVYACRAFNAPSAWRTGINEITFDFEMLAPVASLVAGNFSGGAPPSASPVSIVVSSAGSEVGDFGHVFVDGVDASPNLRGYNIVVINEKSGAIESRASFDTFKSPDESARLAQFIATIPNGRIVAVAVRDEASRNLTQDAVNALRSIGATQDLRGKFRWSHAIIGIKGTSSALEIANEIAPAQIIVGIGALEPNVAAGFAWIKIEEVK
jgi:hypothetical protein